MPTHGERVYWGMGDARDIRAFDLDIGRVGELICYEHHMTLLRAAMVDPRRGAARRGLARAVGHGRPPRRQATGARLPRL